MGLKGGSHVDVSQRLNCVRALTLKRWFDCLHKCADGRNDPLKLQSYLNAQKVEKNMNAPIYHSSICIIKYISEMTAADVKIKSSKYSWFMLFIVHRQAGLLGFPHTTISKVFKRVREKEKISSERQVCVGENVLMLEFRGERLMGMQQ